MTHENYLEQCVALTLIYSILAGRPLPQYPSNKTMPSISWLVFFRTVYVAAQRSYICARLRPEYVREAFSEIQNHLCESRSSRLEKLAERLASTL